MRKETKYVPLLVRVVTGHRAGKEGRDTGVLCQVRAARSLWRGEGQ
jgi:hypothetical protein